MELGSCHVLEVRGGEAEEPQAQMQQTAPIFNIPYHFPSVYFSLKVKEEGGGRGKERKEREGKSEGGKGEKENERKRGQGLGLGE